MKHANDTNQAAAQKHPRAPLPLRAAALLAITLVCAVLLSACGQTFSRSSPASPSAVWTQRSASGEAEHALSVNEGSEAPSPFSLLTGILDVLIRLAALLLLIVCIYLAFIVISLLSSGGKSSRRSRRHTGKERNSHTQEASGPSPEDSSSLKKILHFSAAQSAVPPDRQGKDPDKAQRPDLSGPADAGMTSVVPGAESVTERRRYQELVSFDFQDDRKAFSIMRGDYKQGPICFIESESGILSGSKIGSGRYQVYPKGKILTETGLCYSPVTACFDICKGASYGKKFRIYVDQPAILSEKDDGIYTIESKGKLTVMDTIG